MKHYMIEGRDKDVAWIKVQGFVACDDFEAQAYMERLRQEGRLRRIYKRYRLVQL